MSIATQRPSAVVIAPIFSPASGDLKALIKAKREGYLWRSDLTPDRVQAVRKQLADAERACLPPNPVVVASWLMKLTKLVTNAPAELSRELTEVIFEVCGDIPAGAWNPESRLAWTRQPDRNGYPIGSRWPAPGELHTHLRPFAERIRDEVSALKAMLAMVETPLEQRERRKPTDAEIAAVVRSARMARQVLSNGAEELG
ncbi:hypothetical protein [Gluconobacter wancherniae]|uniref:hypothetical protein n=1 Tax=Gluconobacter wancherniae TaxID=1307955 RepID=UPI001B8BA9CB|nr:hypothetical protein [Gluconobacter wancherniae]MBS1093850.1 hypothetical protein [Gluconobacter wancherniae]